jgi:hypothetical protein
LHPDDSVYRTWPWLSCWAGWWLVVIVGRPPRSTRTSPASSRQTPTVSSQPRLNQFADAVWRSWTPLNETISIGPPICPLHQEAGRTQQPAPTSALGRRWQEALVFLGLRPKYWPGLNTAAWAPVQEVIGLSEVYQTWDHKWMRRFGRDIIASIPSNSVYFGGTDGGRFIVSALSDSQATGQPFFTITQNQLADRTYLDHLQSMYGSRIRMPTATDSQQAFQDYLAAAQRRMEANQLKPGENVQITSGRVQVSGRTAVMEINGLLVYNIFTNNPGREFFIEEAFRWTDVSSRPMACLKLNREPLAELGAESSGDREFWTPVRQELIGDWLTPKPALKVWLSARRFT